MAASGNWRACTARARTHTCSSWSTGLPPLVRCRSRNESGREWWCLRPQIVDRRSPQPQIVDRRSSAERRQEWPDAGKKWPDAGKGSQGPAVGRAPRRGPTHASHLPEGHARTRDRRFCRRDAPRLLLHGEQHWRPLCGRRSSGWWLYGRYMAIRLWPAAQA